MYSYELLETGCYYLVRETGHTPIVLIQPAMKTDHCIMIRRFDDVETTLWKSNSDTLFDILECLTDEKVKEWSRIFNSDTSTYKDEEGDD